MRRACLLLISFLVACSGGEKAKDSGGAPEAGSAGWKIEHITEGTGPSPTPADVVVVHYHGTFPDGQVFDSSVQRGQPAIFPLGGVIPCWTQGLQQMKVGGKA